MEDGTIILFIISLVMFLTSLWFIMTSPVPKAPAPSRPEPPKSTMIGSKCPVGCTCFPNESGKPPSQTCGFLANDTMFSCPSSCCQPTCV